MRQVLMIVPAWPPVNIVSTRRPLRLARRLPELGWNPTVLTPDPPAGFELDEPALDPTLSVPSIDVHRVPGRFPGVQLRRAVRTVMHRVPDFERIVQITFNRVLFPDHFVEWAPAAIQAARRVARERGVDAVWATAPPYGALVVGALVASSLNRPLVVDYRDPWTQAPQPRPRRYPFAVPKWALETLEGAVLRRANGAAYVNPDMRAWNEARFGIPEDATWHAVPNGFEATDLPPAPPAEFDHPTLLYAGSCYRGRTMLPVLQAMYAERTEGETALPRFLFYGELDPDARAFLDRHRDALEGFVEAHGRIPIEELASKMRGADALLLVTASEHDHAVAAKVFDYFLAERPIVAYGPGDGAAADVIRRTGTGLAVPQEEGLEALRRALRQVYQRSLPYAPDASEISRWSADGTAQQMAKLLDSVYETASRGAASRAAGESAGVRAHPGTP